jgi:hypothetical protein
MRLYLGSIVIILALSVAGMAQDQTASSPLERNNDSSRHGPKSITIELIQDWNLLQSGRPPL